MNSKTLLFAGAAGLTLGLVGGCNNNDNGATPAPTTTMQTLDTAHVLALAQQSSETAQPFTVNGAEVSIAQVGDDTAPVSVNGT